MSLAHHRSGPADRQETMNAMAVSTDSQVEQAWCTGAGCMHARQADRRGALGSTVSGESRDTDTIAAHRDHCPFCHIARVARKHLCHQLDTLGGRHVRQPNYATVGRASDNEELSEILIHRHEHAVLRSCPLQQNPVTRIRASFARLNDVIALAAQPLGEPTPSAAIDQKPHCPATRTESSLSCAMTACA